MAIEIEVIDYNSVYLNSVIALGRSCRGTLGFLPDSAFKDYAARRHVLVALDPQNGCIGYLMYRKVDYQIRIVHLCINQKWRGKGIAKQLVNQLSQANKSLYGIGLWCRRDYEVSKIWPKLGFIPIEDKPGRNHDGKLLTFWWFDHGHPTLFSTVTTQQLDSKICVAIDTNIFLDLKTQGDIDSDESKFLLADWLQSEIELCVTDEIYNDIDRNGNKVERRNNRLFAGTFKILPCDQEKFRSVSESIRGYFPENMTARDESDLRHLARSISSNIRFFVTRDTEILDISDEIYEKFNLMILRPADLVLHLDEVYQEAKYQPVRLAGTSISKKHVQSGHQELLTNTFLSHKHSEKKIDFNRKLRRFLSDPIHFECFVAWNGSNPLALVVYNRENDYELEVSMIRVTGEPLSITVAQNIIFNSILVSTQEKRWLTRISELYLHDEIRQVIQNGFFVNFDNEWLKINLPIVETKAQILVHLTNLFKDLSEKQHFFCKLKEFLNSNITDNQTSVKIEKFLWPAKLTHIEMPTFIIPIKPIWAHQLFDEDLANQTLFGATKTELALNIESVYYRSYRPTGGIKAPGRILWYVTNDDDNGYTGVSAIRACSFLEEFVIGKPKELYRRFRRLGVYEWKNVFDIAKKDINNDIMAIRFSSTEVFSKPVALQDIQEILGQTSPIQSPRCIQNKFFEKFYILGTQFQQKGWLDEK